MDTIEKVIPRTIFLTVAGSHLYGTNIEGSDWDFKGVCIPTRDYHYGFLKNFEQLERKASDGAPADLVIMALAKFCKLAVECNPNIVELLFAPEDAIVYCDKFGEDLINHRYDFLSKKARFTFAGYAHSQLKRIKTHRSWLLNPPTEQPSRKDFGLSEETKVSKSELGAFDALVQEGMDVSLHPDVLTLFLRERQYQAKLAHWNQYLRWKAERNEARAALEAQYGYDTKHAMHLIRLMRMCKEILGTLEVVVRRPDAEELLEIRRGAWSYDQVIEMAEQLEAECVALYETSMLCKEPDRVRLDDFVVRLTHRYMDFW